jgi:hypothetical protein
MRASFRKILPTYSGLIRRQNVSLACSITPLKRKRNPLEILDGVGIIFRQELKKDGETLIRFPPLSAGTCTFYCDQSFMGISNRSMGMREI